jgi:hypothetical protein
MTYAQCTVLQTLNYDVERLDVSASMYRAFTLYAKEEAAKAIQRFLDAESRYGAHSPVATKLLGEAMEYQTAYMRLNLQFQDNLDEYEQALEARIAYLYR